MRLNEDPVLPYLKEVKLTSELPIERKPYWGFDGERITFDSERYRRDWKRDLEELCANCHRLQHTNFSRNFY